MAAVLRYFFNHPVCIVVHDCVSTEAKIPFSSCFEIFKTACTNVNLPKPMEFTALVADLELRAPLLREDESEDDCGLMQWAAHGVHKTRLAFFPQDLARSWL